MSSGQSADPRIVRLVRPASPITGEASARHEQPIDSATDDHLRVLPEKTVYAGKPLEVSVSDDGPALPKPVKRKRGERVDWEGIKPHYRANKLSLKAIGALFDVSAPAIFNHAKKQKPPWTRDQTDEINARAEGIVNAAMINAANEKADSVNGLVNGKPRLMTQEVVLQATAEIIAGVRIAQRERFQRMAGLSMKMFQRLELMFEHNDAFEALGELMFNPDEHGQDKLNDLYRKVIEFPGQVRSMKDLTEVIMKLTDMESRTYKLDTTPEGQQGKRKQLTVRFVEAGAPQIENNQP